MAEMGIRQILAMLTMGGISLPSELETVVNAVERGDITALSRELPRLTPLLLDTLRSVRPMLSDSTRNEMIRILQG